MTTGFRRLLTAPPLWLLTAALILALSRPACAQTFQIQAVATPSRVAYGEDNRVTIRVTVHDNEGRVAPDGTQVFFHTTLGELPTLAQTRGGQVEVLLQNTAGPGQAIITVTVGDSRARIAVDYLGPGAEVGKRPERVRYRLKARRAYYSIEQRVFDLLDQAEFVAPTFRVTAGALQYDVRNGILKAQQEVTISAGSRLLTAAKLSLLVSGGQGALIEVEPNIAYKLFSVPALEAKEDERARNEDFQPLSPQPTRTWIICREATVFPQELIQFRRPKFYLNNYDRPLFSLPNHVLDLRSTDAGTFFNSKISLTSDAGLNVDFPIYVTAQDNNVGSLHLRHVTRGSSLYRGTSGLQVGIEEEYLLGTAGDGALYLDDLTRDTRSVSWDHTHAFGDTRINVNASYERYTVETPYTARLGLNASRRVGDADLYLQSNWSGFEGNQDTFVELSATLPYVDLGKTGLALSFRPYVGLTRTAIAATESQPGSADENFYQGLVIGLGFPMYRAAGGTVTATVNDEIAHDGDGTFTNYLDAGMSFRRRLTREFTSSLSYSYGITQSTEQGVEAVPRQRVSLDISGARPQLWSLFSYASYSLEDDALYASANLTYFMPWDRKREDEPRWYLRYRASVTASGQTSSDHLFSLGRNIGPYGLVLHYSPSGNTAVTGIGSGTGKHWAIEIVRQGW